MSKFIAEVSSNHSQDISRAIEFINIASEIGCYAVKFQLFKIDKLFAPEILANSEEHKKRSQWQLPINFLPILSKTCKQKGQMRKVRSNGNTLRSKYPLAFFKF